MTAENHDYIEEEIAPDTFLKRKVESVITTLSDKNIFSSKLLKIPNLGHCLYMDGHIQSSELDEPYYHESLVHPAMLSHPNPQRVLIVGGGELCTLREVLKHNTVKRVDMVDIDKETVEYLKAAIPCIHKNAHLDPRANIIYDDFKRYLKNYPSEYQEDTGLGGRYDVVIYDLVDPFEGSEVVSLYYYSFIKEIKDKLMNKDSVFVTQSTSLQILNYETAFRIRATVEKVFGNARIYGCFMPSFMEVWGFTIANCDQVDIRELKNVDSKIKERKLDEKEPLQYYDEKCHEKMFTLSKPLRKLLKEKEFKILSEENCSKFK